METVTLDMEQGATMRVTLLYKDADDLPIPLDGLRAHMQIRKRQKTTATMLIDLTTENGGVTLGPEDGEIHIRVSATETANVTRNAWYDLHLISTTDPTEVTRVFGGQILLTPGVTVDA